MANTSVSDKECFYLLDSTALGHKWWNMLMGENSKRQHKKFSAQEAGSGIAMLAHQQLSTDRKLYPQ